MRREELVDLNAFVTVAEEQSFTRAAARLGTSQSALIQTYGQRIRSQGCIPGQDGDPHGPILISPAASSAIGINRVSDRRSTVRPSLTHHWQTLWAACVASDAGSPTFDHPAAEAV